MSTAVCRAALAALVVGFATACTTLPQSPSLPASIPAQWSVDSAALVRGERPLDWWREFEDPRLDALVAEALLANRDLVAADARLRAARALARDAQLARGPSGELTAQYSRTRVAALSQPPVEGTPAEFATQRLVDTGLEFRWQLDFAGGLAAARDAAAADAEEALWQRRQAEAGVAAATVEAWLDRDDARRALQVLDARIAALAGIRARLRGAVALGALREADAALADLAYEEARALALQRGLALRNAERRLATLTNRAPGALEFELESASPAYPARLPVLEPLATLRSRPDVGAAEARVRAAFARAGVAEAALYPQISLVGAVGLSAPGARLDEPGARRFVDGPVLAWSVFDLPRLRAQARAAGAQADAELAAFHATTLAALEEADSALDGWRAASDSSDRIDAARAAAARAAQLIEARSAAGLASALDVARARADAMDWELAAIDARGQARRAWAATLLALGAGWRDGYVRP